MKKIVIIIYIFLMSGLNVFAYDFDTWDETKNESENEISMGTMNMEGEFLDGDILKIAVNAEDISSPLLGISFHLNFDSVKLAFLRYEPGEFLERGGDPFYLVRVDEGKIFFGETLRRNDDFPVGSGTVAYFYFQILEEDLLNFEFANGVLSTLDTVRQDLDNIFWENLELEKKPSGLMKELQNNVISKSEIPWVYFVLLLGGLTGFCVFIFAIRKSKKRLVNFK